MNVLIGAKVAKIGEGDHYYRSLTDVFCRINYL